jgi:hypothetical protein
MITPNRRAEPSWADLPVVRRHHLGSESSAFIAMLGLFTIALLVRAYR